VDRPVTACPALQLPPKPTQPDEAPLLSIVLVHHDRPKLLKQAIAAIEAQTCQNFEVVLVDDGSREPEAQELLADLAWRWWQDRGWKVLREPNRYQPFLLGHY